MTNKNINYKINQLKEHLQYQADRLDPNRLKVGQYEGLSSMYERLMGYVDDIELEVQRLTKWAPINTVPPQVRLDKEKAVCPKCEGLGQLRGEDGKILKYEERTFCDCEAGERALTIYERA